MSSPERARAAPRLTAINLIAALIAAKGSFGTHEST
jgi:hypothetical protein